MVRLSLRDAARMRNNLVPQEYIKNFLSQPLNLEKVEAHVKTHVMESDTSLLFAFALKEPEKMQKHKKVLQ